MKRFITLMLALAMAFSLSTTTFATSANGDNKTTAEAITRIGEVPELREHNSDTYALSDGSYQCVVYAEDKYFSDEDGKLTEIDNTIVATDYVSEKTFYGYKNSANSFDVYFAKNDPSVFVTSKESSISFTLIGATATPATVGGYSSANIAVDGSLHTNIAGYSLHGCNYICYSEVFPNTDVMYSVGNGSLKEYIILKNANTPAEFSFLLDTADCTVEECNGNIVFCNAAGEEVFQLAPLFAVDANGAYAPYFAYTLTENSDSTITVSFSIPASYLNNVSRSFPVLVDPSIMITGDACTYDTYVSSKYPTTNYYLNNYLRTGKDDDYYVRRSYIRFDIPDAVSDGTVTSAYLNIKKYSGADPSVTANRVTGAWTSSTLTWNNKPGYSTVNAASLQAYSDNWYRAYITGIVRSWVYGEYSNYGCVLLDSTETNTSQWTTFYSSDAASPNKPELHITYTSNKSARLVGVTNTNHNHSGCLASARTILQDCDLYAVYMYTGAFTVANIQNYLDDGETGVFISRSHGGITENTSGQQTGTNIVLDDEPNPARFRSTTSMNSLDLSNLTLVMFIACQTGCGGEGGLNLPTVAVNKGATTAVGFEDEILCTSANSWTINFCNYMKNGTSVKSACSVLASLATYKGTGLDTYVICGNKNVTLN